MDYITAIRAFYLGSAALVVLAALTPALRTRFLSYGARASSSPSSTSSTEQDKKLLLQQRASRSTLTYLLDELQQWQVPHDWFWTFYALSLTLSTFWPPEAMLLHGPLYELIRDHAGELATSMTFEQLKVTWAMMLVQGGRRLYESLVFVEWEEFGTDKRMSMMWGGHWVMGLAFYIVTSVAFWVEGIPAIEAHTPTYSDLIFKAPSFRTIFSVLLFTLASGFQHDCHSYLAYLKRQPAPASSSDSSSINKSSSHTTTTTISSTTTPHTQAESTYKLPTHPAFLHLIAPHYTAEIFIYVALAVVSAPQGLWWNNTMGCAALFVAVNLGVTAEGTRRWYQDKFGEEGVRGKWRLVPGFW